MCSPGPSNKGNIFSGLIRYELNSLQKNVSLNAVRETCITMKFSPRQGNAFSVGVVMNYAGVYHIEG